MKFRFPNSALLTIFALIFLSFSAVSQQSFNKMPLQNHGKNGTHELYPVQSTFEENGGQVGGGIKFFSRSESTDLAFEKDRVLFGFTSNTAKTKRGLVGIRSLNRPHKFCRTRPVYSRFAGHFQSPNIFQ